MRRLAVGFFTLCTGGCITEKAPNPAQVNMMTATGNTGSVETLHYGLTTVNGCMTNPGTQTVLRAKGSELALVTIAQTSTTSTCTVMGQAPTQTPNFQLCYVESSGATLTAQTAATIPLIALEGVGLAVSAGGEVAVGYTGGPNTPLRCGGSDFVVVKKTGAAFGAPVTVATDSTAPKASAEVTASCNLQGICDAGDATGFWPSLLYDNNNTLLASFRDMHFGAVGSDNAKKSDVELATGASVLTIDGGRGAGLYSRVAVTPQNKVSVVHYNGDGAQEFQGIWLLHDGDGGWTSQRLTDAQIGESLGFGVNGDGLHALAYYSVQEKRLKYMESADALSWTDAEDVDIDGDTGQYPSLAFDGNGEPVITYYRCNDYAKNTSTCDQAKDGLYMARRVMGVWKRAKIAAEPATFEGLYSSVALVGGKITVAYQKRSFDASSNTATSELIIAREP